MFIAASLPDKIISTAKKLLTDLGFSPYRADLWDRIVVFAVIILLAFIVWLVFAKGIIPIIKYIVNHSRLKIDRILYERKFFNRLFDLIPPIIVLFLLPLAFDKNFENVKVIIEKLMSIYLVFIFAKIIIALIEAAFDFYLIKHEIETSPYKGVVEMARIFIYCIMCLAIAGILRSEERL